MKKFSIFPFDGFDKLTVVRNSNHRLRTLNSLKGNFQFSNDSQEGFSLIETVVALMIFSIVAILVGSIFARAVALERRIVSTQKVQDNSTFILESMAKEIRVSNIVNQDSPNCTATMITMNHPIYGAITYSLSSGGDILRNAAIAGIINSAEVQITRFQFCITGSANGDKQSPKVTILISLKNRKGAESITVNLQTTLTSRDIASELQL